MNRTSLTILLATSMAATVGCASKNYVRQETTPLINKTNELDDLTAKNTKDIRDVDARAQAGIQQVQTKAAEVDQKAQTAGQQAAQAQTMADTATHRVLLDGFGGLNGDTQTVAGLHGEWSAARAADRGNRVDQRQQLRDIVAVRAGQDRADRNAVRVYEDVVLGPWSRAIRRVRSRF